MGLEPLCGSLGRQVSKGRARLPSTTSLPPPPRLFYRGFFCAHLLLFEHLRIRPQIYFEIRFSNQSTEHEDQGCWQRQSTGAECPKHRSQHSVSIRGKVPRRWTLNYWSPKQFSRSQELQVLAWCGTQTETYIFLSLYSRSECLTVMRLRQDVPKKWNSWLPLKRKTPWERRRCKKSFRPRYSRIRSSQMPTRDRQHFYRLFNRSHPGNMIYELGLRLELDKNYDDLLLQPTVSVADPPFRFFYQRRLRQCSSLKNVVS